MKYNRACLLCPINVLFFLFKFQSVCIKSEVDPSQVAGIGFDATCSMVVLDTDCKPLSVCPTGTIILFLV